MSPVVSLTLRALRACGAGPLADYASALRAACAAAPPPFGTAWYGRRFRALAVDPGWVAASLIENAACEVEGAGKIWSLAARTRDPEIADAVRRHAVDESRHALIYLALLDAAFPGAVAARVRRGLDRLSPGFRDRDRPPVRRPLPERRVLDELIQMNVGEIRTRLNQLLLTPVITTVCPPTSRPRVRRMMASLLADETRHIAYTAHLIERAMLDDDGAFVRRTMRRRLAQFNRITLAQIGRRTHALA